MFPNASKLPCIDKNKQGNNRKLTANHCGWCASDHVALQQIRCESMANTDLDIAEFMGHVGKGFPRLEQSNYEVNRDVILHFAWAIPDVNAIYLDNTYASDTRGRGIITPTAPATGQSMHQNSNRTRPRG